MTSGDTVTHAAMFALALVVGATLLLAPHLGNSDLWSKFQERVSPPGTVTPPAAPPAVIIQPPVQPPLVVVIPPPAVDLPPAPKLQAPKSIATPERVRRPKARPRETIGLPPCSVIQREYARMSPFEQLAAYARATPEQVAHGKRCLGMT